MEKTAECLTQVKAYLESAPDLASYDYQDWDQTTEEFVNGCWVCLGVVGHLMATAESVNRKSVSSPIPPTASAPVAPVSTSSLPDPLAAASKGIDPLDSFDDASFDDELYSSL